MHIALEYPTTLTPAWDLKRLKEIWCFIQSLFHFPEEPVVRAAFVLEA